MSKAIVGKSGEDITAAYLRKKGWAITKRNYHSRFGEIDIIAENDEYIIFVEVKTRAENSLTSPAEAVNLSKQRKIMLTAEDFLSKFTCELQPRFDVAEVTTYKNADGSFRYSLNYIKNAF